mmetsp:Transcript_64238/g.153679  ORF Transcript_64238/g.153679 Transcript_64238/m.153679 type:complete len:200 (+) Transcript_64238:849-1448(+)
MLLLVRRQLRPRRHGGEGRAHHLRVEQGDRPACQDARGAERVAVGHGLAPGASSGRLVRPHGQDDGVGQAVSGELLGVRAQLQRTRGERGVYRARGRVRSGGPAGGGQEEGGGGGEEEVGGYSLPCATRFSSHRGDSTYLRSSPRAISTTSFEMAFSINFGTKLPSSAMTSNETFDEDASMGSNQYPPSRRFTTDDSRT